MAHVQLLAPGRRPARLGRLTTDSVLPCQDVDRGRAPPVIWKSGRVAAGTDTRQWLVETGSDARRPFGVVRVDDRVLDLCLSLSRTACEACCIVRTTAARSLRRPRSRHRSLPASPHFAPASHLLFPSFSPSPAPPPSSSHTTRPAHIHQISSHQRARRARVPVLPLMPALRIRPPEEPRASRAPAGHPPPFVWAAPARRPTPRPARFPHRRLAPGAQRPTPTLGQILSAAPDRVSCFRAGSRAARLASGVYV